MPIMWQIDLIYVITFSSKPVLFLLNILKQINFGYYRRIETKKLALVTAFLLPDVCLHLTCQNLKAMKHLKGYPTTLADGRMKELTFRVCG